MHALRRVGARLVPGRSLRMVWDRSCDDLTFSIEHPVDNGWIHPPRDGSRKENRLVLRPALGADHAYIDAVRRADSQWLSPWEASLPPGSHEAIPSLITFQRQVDAQQKKGESLLLMVESDDTICGLLSLSNVQRGAMSQGVLGYWVTSTVAGRGIASLCVALMLDLVIGELGLHRVEVNVRPENGPSLALCHKLGLREEGLRERYMAIAGAWADHVLFAIDSESLPPGGLVKHLWGKPLL